MDFLSEYGLFLAKSITVVIAILGVLITAAVLKRSQSAATGKGRGQLEVQKINEFYLDMQHRLESSLLDKKAQKALQKKRKEEAKKSDDEQKKKVFVLDFEGDIKASAAEQLRHEVSAVLSIVKPQDEVVVRLESTGGMVHAYGFAASQLARVRSAGIPLTVCVDKVAASGGYMMACIGTKILSAPFAVLGSIGVVAQLPNVHRLLKKHEIDYEMLTAGEFKRTLTVFGENTDKGREKFQEDLETTHQLFKDFISLYRPQLLIDEVATGEIWLGTSALGKDLVDELMTSDEYIMGCIQEADIYRIQYVEKQGLSQKLGGLMGSVVSQSIERCSELLSKQSFLR